MTDKHCSLLQHGLDYECKYFSNTVQNTQHHFLTRVEENQKYKRSSLIRKKADEEKEEEEEEEEEEDVEV